MRNLVLFATAALVLVGMVGWAICKDGNCLGGPKTERSAGTLPRAPWWSPSGPTAT